MSKESKKEEANESKKEEVMSILITPNVEGYPLAEACQILQQAGFEVVMVASGSPGPNNARVLRQRQLDVNLIELIHASELYKDPSLD